MLSRITVLAMLAVLTLGMSGTAQAQPADQRTYFTFSAPVTLPGVTLPAGKYLFRLADENGSRRLISVLSEDGKKPYALLLTIPNQLPTPPENPEIRFMETAANMPPAIKTWWYPGRATGYEFIYPRQQALLLAKVSGETVLTTSATSEDPKTADLARISGSGEPEALTAKETATAPAANGSAQQGARRRIAATGRTQRGTVASDVGAGPSAGEPSATAIGGAQQGAVASDVGGSAADLSAQSAAADESAQANALTEQAPTSSWLLASLLGVLVTAGGVGLYLWKRSRI